MTFRHGRVLKTANVMSPWGYSSVGRALDWQSRGQGFESPYLHFVVALTTFSLVRRRFLEERSCLKDVIHEFEGANRRPTALELAWLTREEPCAPGRGVRTSSHRTRRRALSALARTGTTDCCKPTSRITPVQQARRGSNFVPSQSEALNGLTGDRCDEIEILIDMEHGQRCQLCRRSDEHVWN